MNKIGEIFYHDDDWEYSHHDASCLVEDLWVDPVEPIMVHRLQRIAPQYYTKTLVDGRPVWRLCDTEEEAKALWADPEPQP